MALTTTPNKAAPRTALLLGHSGHGDSRVQRTCMALMDAGMDVRLFTLRRSKEAMQSKKSDLNHIAVRAVELEEGLLYPPPLSYLRNIRRKYFTENIEPSTIPNPNKKKPLEGEISDRNLSFIHKIARSLSALFWHQAVAKSMFDEVSRFDPDVIFANDLSMLGAGVIISGEIGARIIYDAHEFEQDRNGVEETVAEYIRRLWEGRLILHADAVITVGEAIAARLSKLYGISKPTVVLNIPNDSLPDERLSRSAIGMPENAYVVLYVGTLAVGRGVEVMIDALPEAILQIPDIYFAVAGPSTLTRWEALHKQAYRLGVADRLIKIEAVPENQVTGLISLADVSVIPTLPSCESYRLGLPNKLFKSLRSGTPVVATPLPEVATILKKYGGGVVTTGYGPADLLDGIMKGKEDARLSNLPNNYSAKEGARRITVLVKALALRVTPPDALSYDFDISALHASYWRPVEKGLKVFFARFIVSLVKVKKSQKNNSIESLKS